MLHRRDGRSRVRPLFLPTMLAAAWLTFGVVRPNAPAEKGAGPVRFTEHLIRDKYGYAYGIAAADLDGDGKPDVIATAWGSPGQVVWFQNPGGKGAWKRHVLKGRWPNANQVIAADLNGDGRLDLAAVAERGSNEFRWWRNEGRPKK